MGSKAWRQLEAWQTSFLKNLPGSVAERERKQTLKRASADCSCLSRFSLSTYKLNSRATKSNNNVVHISKRPEKKILSDFTMK